MKTLNEFFYKNHLADKKNKSKIKIQKLNKDFKKINLLLEQEIKTFCRITNLIDDLK